MGVPSTKRFEIRRRLGEGGMGVVYEAFDEERRSTVALKTLNRIDGNAIARFKREFRALQGLAHPNLVALDELFFESDQWFFTMELLDGVDFVSHVRGHAPHVAFQSTVRESISALAARSVAGDVERVPSSTFDETRLRDGLKQLLEGLAALHAVDKVHRDVKPSNVFVTREGRVVLLDFGLVTEASAENHSTGAAVVGTPAYMAPEQAASRDVGPAADLYSVGVMLYEALTGRIPIEGAPLQILIEKQTREPLDPATLVPSVPKDLSLLCMKLLRFDPAARPTAGSALRSLSTQGSVGAVGPRISTEAPTFVGRGAELAELRAAFETSRQGELATVLVCGESGIGKSYMVRRFTGQVLTEHPDAMLLEGRCYERESVPYKTLDGIADALSRRLSRMPATDVAAVLPRRGSAILAHAFPVMLRVAQVAKEHSSLALNVDPQELRRRAFAALRDLFARLSLRWPTVVVIDDLQWADDDGLGALAEILRPPDAPPLLVIGTVRMTPGGEDARLARVRAAIPGVPRVVALASLDHGEARDLAVAMLRRADNHGANPERIATEAGGHPLFVEELARHVALGGAAREDVKLDDAIWSRIVQLEAPTRAMAELVAVAGKPIPQEVIAAAAHLEPGEFNRRAAMLRASNLIRTGGTRWVDAIEPYHDRVREAVLAQLEPEQRRALHEALAIAFEGSQHHDPETLATHWRDAGDPTRAGKHAISAGEQASRTFAFERAAEWYQRALEWLPPDEAGRLALRVRLGDMLANAGRGALAAPHFEAAAEHSPPMKALDLRRRAAEELLSAGRFEEGDAVLKNVLDAVGIHLPRTPLAALLGLAFFRFVVFVRGLGFRERREEDIAAHALTRLEACDGVGRILALVDNIRGAYFQTRALLAALAIGEPNRVAHSLAIEAIYLASGGNSSRSTQLLVQAREIAQRTGSVPVQALVEASTGFAHFVLGRFQVGITCCDRSAEILREQCPGAWWELRTAQLAAIWAVAWTGDLNGLSARVDRGVREARDRGDIYALTTLRTGTPNLNWLRRGDVSGARAIAREAMDQWTQAGYHSQHYWSLLALTRIDLYEGNAREAHVRVAREWPQVTRSLILRVRIMGVEARHLRASAALAAAATETGAERSRLIRLAEAEGRSLGHARWSVATGLAHLVWAGAAALRGNPELAAAELEVGARRLDALSMGLHAASAKWHLGRIRGGDEGRALVEGAEAWMRVQEVAGCAAIAGMLIPGFAR